MVMEQCDQPTAEAIRIILGDEDSKTLLEAGTFFAVIQRGQYPQQHGGQMILHVLPCDYTTAAAAVEVAMGRRKPGRRLDTTA